MKSRVLISQICRTIETADSSGSGATLADEYAAAVAKANARLDAVIAAADANSIGDAIRLISEEPPLLEEVSTLDFFQLQDWESLCEMNGWAVPPKINKQAMERAVEIGETKGAIEPFLAMYKKAIRVNNVRLAVKSLRRLVDLDHSQDWSRNLKQSERQLQALIVEEFDAARRNGLEETCDRLAQELLDGVWKDGLSVKGVDEIRRYRERQEAKRRDAEGRENITILRKCLDEKWNRKLAFSIIQSIDGLVEKKWTIPDEAREVVDLCRAWCAKEFEQDEIEKRWREVNEQLHAAIQKEDCAAIRAALSVPEFLDRDPLDGMLNQAKDILEHADAARRRKTFQIAAFSFFAVLAVLGASGWWLKQKLFAKRCDDAAMNLAYLERQSKVRPKYAIEGMGTVLSKLKRDDPDVYANPKVIQFEASLKSVIAENVARTNQLERVLYELERLRADAWAGDADSSFVTGQICRAEALLAKDDDTYRARLLSIKDSWMDAVEKKAAESRERASKFYDILASQLRMIAERLTKELARAELQQEVRKCRASLDEWKANYSEYDEELAAKMLDVEKGFNDAVEEQCAYTNALGKLAAARTVDEILTARKELIESYGNYPEAKSLRSLDVDLGEIKDALSSEPAEVKSFLARMRGGITQAEFENFIKENVLTIADSPVYYSLYGLIDKEDRTGKILALSKGKPKIRKPSYETMWQITSEQGDLLNFGKKSFVSEMKSRHGVDEVLMPSSDEMKTIVEIAERKNLTVVGFEAELLKVINKHIIKGHESKFLENEKKFATFYNPVRGWMSPFRRVQFLAWYMRWLKEDLKVMPDDMELLRWYNDLDSLSADIRVDGVDESLSWICIWDERIRRRTIECAKVLNRMPSDWVDRYRRVKASRRELAVIEGWKVVYAGKVQFDPLDPTYEKDPKALHVSAPNVAPDHPLYVLRKINGKVSLVRAFEPGKIAKWRKSKEMERAGEGYALGEPLYHVFSRGRFIDVQDALKEIAKRAGLEASDRQIESIPLYSTGGR